MLKKTISGTMLTMLLVGTLYTVLDLKPVAGWSNGGYSSDPNNPNHGTHDRIAQDALDWLPNAEKEYIVNNSAIYLYGTELPDNSGAPDGIGDTALHHMYYWSDGSMQDDASAIWAQAEYDDALICFKSGNFTMAAKTRACNAYDGYGNVPASADYLSMAALPWGDWKHYHNYDEIVDTLLYLNSTYSNIVDVFSIGKSWQNRTIYCVRLTNESMTRPKPKLFFVGYHHAREPISAELPLYFAVEVATNFGTNTTLTHMLNCSEIYIVVALNVDAFDIRKQNEWQRKNAHPFGEDGDGLLDEDPPDDEDGDGYIEDLFFDDGTHYRFIRWEGIDDDGDGLLNEDWVGGVDLNRNYDYKWNATCNSGSPYSWAEDYRGPAPFSEPETQAIKDLALQNDFKYAVSFHSGAEDILYPWGYTHTPTPDDQIFREVASNLSALTGSPYEQSSAMYTTSGVWDDWMYANRSTLAFTCEIYGNYSAWQYEPGPEPNTWWERGISQAFNPDPSQIETVIQRWLPVFTCITNRAITEAYSIATTNVTPIKTVVGQGFSMHVNATVTNKGDFTETFTVTIYVNTTEIETREIALTSESSTTLTFTWNTTNFTKGNYTMMVYATPVPGETDTTDNRRTDGWVIVACSGDLTSETHKGVPDGKVDEDDLWYFCSAFIDYYTIHVEDSNCDFDNNCKIDEDDLWTFCAGFIEYWKHH